jgi:hypothetical protein
MAVYRDSVRCSLVEIEQRFRSAYSFIIRAPWNISQFLPNYTAQNLRSPSREKPESCITSLPHKKVSTHESGVVRIWHRVFKKWAFFGFYVHCAVCTVTHLEQKTSLKAPNFSNAQEKLMVLKMMKRLIHFMLERIINGLPGCCRYSWTWRHIFLRILVSCRMISCNSESF